MSVINGYSVRTRCPLESAVDKTSTQCSTVPCTREPCNYPSTVGFGYGEGRIPRIHRPGPRPFTVNHLFTER